MSLKQNGILLMSIRHSISLVNGETAKTRVLVCETEDFLV